MRVGHQIFSSLILGVYLISIMGLGRYSCGCSASGKLVFWGIVSYCECVKKIAAEDSHKYTCVCGNTLTVKKRVKHDCCPIKFYFIEEDHNVATTLFVLATMSVPPIKPLSMYLVQDFQVNLPIIKDFQSLFHWRKGALFIKNGQFKL